VAVLDGFFSFLRKHFLILIVVIIAFLIMAYPAGLIRYSKAGGEFAGKGLGAFFEHAEIAKLTAAGVTVETKAAERANAAATATTTTNQIDALTQRLIRIEREFLDRGVPQATLSETARDTSPIEETVGSPLQTAVAELQRSADQAARSAGLSATAPVGWIYVGPVTRDGTAWGRGSPRSITPTASPPDIGDTVTLSAATNLRGEKPAGKPWRTDAPIIRVIPAATRAEVLARDAVEALDPATSFLWLQVKLRP
jgi:hypothetical protein